MGIERGILRRLVLPAAIVLSLAAAASAQVGDFGRNKPSTEMHNWRYVQTPHFDVYFYEGMDELSRIATVIIEESYEQISASFDYRLRNRIPIILYRSHQGFTQTHVTGGLIPEGVGGFTEFLKNRVALPFEGSYPLFRHVIHHELTHAVMNDMLYGREILAGVQQSDIPLWFTEGLAEYESIPWSAEADMWMRDAVVNDRLSLDGYFAYKGGQAFISYIAETYGPDKIPQILHRLRSFARFGPTVQAVLGIEIDKLGEKWEKDLKKVYWPEIAERDWSDDVGEPLTDHTKDNSYFNRDPAFSPFGDKIAFMTGRDYYTSIYVMSAIDGKILWKLVAGEQSGSFEEMHWQRGGITWSPDGKLIAFAAKSTEGDRLYIVDSRSGDRRRSFDLDMDGIYSPSWSPDGRTIAFAGQVNGKTDLYLLDIESRRTSRLMDDFWDDTDPKWSPDGTKLLFASDRVPGQDDTEARLLYGTKDLYLVDVATRQLRRLTDDPGDDTNPTWGPDGKNIAFVSDGSGIYNLYTAQIGDGDGLIEDSIRPLTNILTGAFFPSWSPTGDKIAYTAFGKGGWNIHVIRDPLRQTFAGPLRPAYYVREARLSFAGARNDTVYVDTTANFAIGPRTAPQNPDRNLLASPAVDSARGGFNPRGYRASLDIDNVEGYANYSTLGGVGGLLQVSASDLLGYHQLIFVTSLYRDLRDSDYALFYQYLRRRTDYAIYAIRQRTWYPFNTGLEAGLVERSDLNAGVYASRPTSQYRRFEIGVEVLRTSTSALYDYLSNPVDFVRGTTRKSYLLNTAFVHDNALWNYFGPMMGSRWRATFFAAPPAANSAPFGVVTGDFRRYWRVGSNSSFAFRVSGGAAFAEKDENAPAFYLGGLPYWINYSFEPLGAGTLINDQFSQLVFPLRGANYYELVGRKYSIVNAEYRFPLIYFLATGFPATTIFQNIGGVLFIDAGKVWDVPAGIDNRAENDFIGGYGYGVRFNLGVLVLRIDAAWRTDFKETFGSARYYWSFGYDF